MLRLVTSAVGPVSAAVGTPPAAQVVEAYNAGTGSLALSAAPASGATWLAASVGSPRSCTTTTAASSCIPLTFNLSTASLATGTYTAGVTITDANNAVDSPQVITVTVQVGGGVPASIGQTPPVYVAPGSTASVSFSTNSMINGRPTTQDGGKWLSLALQGTGSFRFVLPYQVNLSPPASMAPGTYQGTLVTSGSSFAADNKTIPVTMQVTTQPIAAPSPSQLSLVLAQNGPATTYPFVPAISLGNSGQGALTVQGVSATGTGISAIDYSGLGIVTVDPTGLAPGSYTGSVVMACNAVNCPVTVPVSFQVVAQAAPTINYQGAVNNATQVPGESVCPGDWMALLGQQLSLDPYATASAIPLPASLGGATVLVNGEAAPLFYTSFGQIAFQMPTDTALGTALVQVQRDQQGSNTISLSVVQRAPRILAITDGNYNVLTAGTAVTAGEGIIIWAYGLGPNSPAIPAGAAATDNTPVATMPAVNFGGGLAGINVVPDFAGTGVGQVSGLYQINATIPGGAPKGIVDVSLVFPDSVSNSIPILIQ